MNFLEQLLSNHESEVSKDNWEIYRAGYSACYTDMYKDAEKVQGNFRHSFGGRPEIQWGEKPFTHTAYLVGVRFIEAKAQLVDDECQ